MSAAPVTPEDLAARASALYRRKHREWAADPQDVAELEMGLKVPSERVVLDDVTATIAWITSWREAELALPISVTWGERRWANVGRQSVPERVRLEGAEAIAWLAGGQDAFAALAQRCAVVRQVLEAAGGDVSDVVGAVRRHATSIGDMGEADFGVLAGVVRWLAEHPSSRRFVRELPIRGIHSKWIEERRALVSGLVGAVTGSDLGLALPPRLVRLRSLDPAWMVAGLSDVTVRVDEAGVLEHVPDVVIVTENLQTFLALPPRRGAIALFGGGFAIDAWGTVPWLAGKRILYWGDIDSHGFAIVHRARSHGLVVETVLMDTETLEKHVDLCVPEPSPTRAELPLLTHQERQTLTDLRARSDARLEQERVSWDYAVTRIDQVLRLE